MQFQISLFKKNYSINIIHILLLIILAGAAIRLYKLQYTGLWLDEIYSMKGASPSSTFDEVYKYSTNDQPPVYFFILHVWLKLFGYHDVSGRALACVIGIFGILSMYFLGKEFKDERVGLLAAFITALNWFHVGVSMEVRFYVLVFLFSTLSYLFFLQSIKRTSVFDFVGYAIFTGLLLNTHYFGMVVFATQLLIFIVVIFSFKRSPKLLIGGLLAGIAAALTFLHWESVLDHDLQFTTFYVKPVNVRLLSKFIWWYVYDPAAFLLYLVFGGVTIRAWYVKFIEKKFAVDDLVIVGWAIIGFTIPFIYSLFRMPLFTNKYCIIQLPVIFLMVALGLGKIRRKWMLNTSIVVLIVSASTVLFLARPPYKKSWQRDAREMTMMYFTMNEADEKTLAEDWREVARFFAADSLKGDAVFSQLSWFHEYYFEQFNLAKPLDPNVVNVQEVIKDKNQIWLLLHNDYKDKYQKTLSFLPSQKVLIRNEFELKDIVYFKRSKAFAYRRKEDK